MSKETLTTLNTNTLISHTATRGTAWHYRADLQGDAPNHYPDAIPVEDVQLRETGSGPHDYRIAFDHADTAGVIAIHHDRRLHHLAIGRAHNHQPVLARIAGPTKDHQPRNNGSRPEGGAR